MAKNTYTFDTYKKEHLRYEWLSGNYTDDELRSRRYEDYVTFCKEHGYERED